MLDDISFVGQSVNINLYFLRTLREFCATIQLASLESNSEYSDRAMAIALRCEELGRLLVEYSNGNVSQKALDYQIFVTEFTLPIEKLTEKLFSIKIATDITEEEMNLTAGVPTIPSLEVVDNIMKFNEEALIICNDLRELCVDIFVKQRSNNLFLYIYPSLLLFMIREIDIYKLELERLINKSIVDPIYASDVELLYNLVMQAVAGFLGGLIDPYNQEEVRTFHDFNRKFEEQAKLYRTVPITPDNQKELIQQSIKLADEFHEFMKVILQYVLDSKINFIIEPLFLDNMYTEINYFRYLLIEDSEKVE